MNKVLKFLLFVSSFIPLYVLIFLKVLIDITQGNLSFNVTNSLLLSFCLLLCAGGIAGVVAMLKSKKQCQEISIVEFVNVTDQSYLSFFSLFVLFAVSFEIEYISMFVVYCVVLVFIGLVYVKNELFYINPFMNLIGYSCYQITFKTAQGQQCCRKMFARFQLKKGSGYVIQNHVLVTKSRCLLHKGD